MVDASETAPEALVRELREETGVDLAGRHPIILSRSVVNDWRNSDRAWIASTSALYQLPTTVTAIGSDDALETNWWPAGSLDQLTTAITAAGRTLYTAHLPLLQRALDHLDATGHHPRPSAHPKAADEQHRHRLARQPSRDDSRHHPHGLFLVPRPGRLPLPLPWLHGPHPGPRRGTPVRHQPPSTPD